MLQDSKVIQYDSDTIDTNETKDGLIIQCIIYACVVMGCRGVFDPKQQLGLKSFCCRFIVAV